jgi:cytochrome oxidase Cu insertion factor (SCO1/SenC/PrrC family)
MMIKGMRNAALLALLAAGCSAPTTQGPDGPRLRPGDVAPAVAGTDAEGRPVKLSDFAGKVVLLDFWRTD